MTEADRVAFATLMLGLGETYGEPVSDARLEIYFAALGDLDLAALRTAAFYHAKFQRFFPRPVELREAIHGSADDRAEMAWLAVLRLIRRVGQYAVPKDDDWPDAATKRAAQELFGGWRALCEKLPGEGPELLGFRKSFLATYRAYDARLTREALPQSETGRELSQQEAATALANVKVALKDRGLPTHDEKPARSGKR
jgi:hypothetical protein